MRRFNAGWSSRRSHPGHAERRLSAPIAGAVERRRLNLQLPEQDALVADASGVSEACESDAGCIGLHDAEPSPRDTGRRCNPWSAGAGCRACSGEP